jgi:DNA processing protein
MVVALGDVLIVAEALRDSGSMRSVAYAKKMGKKIYTFPHRVGESDGTMDLVKAGEAEVIYDIDTFVAQYGHIKKIENDGFLLYCEGSPSYEDALQKFGEKVSMYELEGKIVIKDGRVSTV